MKKFLLTGLLCLTAAPAFAANGGMAPGQSLNAAGTSSTMISPGAAAVTNAGSIGAATAAIPNTVIGTPLQPTQVTGMAFAQHKAERLGMLQHNLVELQTRLQCIQMAMDEPSLLACEHPRY